MDYKALILQWKTKSEEKQKLEDETSELESQIKRRFLDLLGYPDGFRKTTIEINIYDPNSRFSNSRKGLKEPALDFNLRDWEDNGIYDTYTVAISSLVKGQLTKGDRESNRDRYFAQSKRDEEKEERRELERLKKKYE